MAGGKKKGKRKKKENIPAPLSFIITFSGPLNPKVGDPLHDSGWKPPRGAPERCPGQHCPLCSGVTASRPVRSERSQVQRQAAPGSHPGSARGGPGNSHSSLAHTSLPAAVTGSGLGVGTKCGLGFGSEAGDREGSPSTIRGLTGGETSFPGSERCWVRRWAAGSVR